MWQFALAHQIRKHLHQLTVDRPLAYESHGACSACRRAATGFVERGHDDDRYGRRALEDGASAFEAADAARLSVDQYDVNVHLIEHGERVGDCCSFPQLNI